MFNCMLLFCSSNDNVRAKRPSRAVCDCVPREHVRVLAKLGLASIIVSTMDCGLGYSFQNLLDSSYTHPYPSHWDRPLAIFVAR